jgi:hypothetical protein
MSPLAIATAEVLIGGGGGDRTEPVTDSDVCPD